MLLVSSVPQNIIIYQLTVSKWRLFGNFDAMLSPFNAKQDDSFFYCNVEKIQNIL